MGFVSRVERRARRLRVPVGVSTGALVVTLGETCSLGLSRGGAARYCVTYRCPVTFLGKGEALTSFKVEGNSSVVFEEW